LRLGALISATIHFNPWTADDADFADGVIRALRMIRGQRFGRVDSVAAGALTTSRGLLPANARK
jgi:hypothetical protein